MDPIQETKYLNEIIISKILMFSKKRKLKKSIKEEHKIPKIYVSKFTNKLLLKNHSYAITMQLINLIYKNKLPIYSLPRLNLDKFITLKYLYDTDDDSNGMFSYDGRFIENNILKTNSLLDILYKCYNGFDNKKPTLITLLMKHEKDEENILKIYENYVKNTNILAIPATQNDWTHHYFIESALLNKNFPQELVHNFCTTLQNIRSIISANRLDEKCEKKSIKILLELISKNNYDSYSSSRILVDIISKNGKLAEYMNSYANS